MQLEEILDMDSDALELQAIAAEGATQDDPNNFLKYIPYYHLCNVTNFTKLPLCQNSTPPEGMSFGYEDTIKIVVPIIFGIVVLIGLFGNTLVVIVIVVNKQMRSTTNYLIFSLALADLLFIIFCVPFTASDYILQAWPFGSIWCKMVQYLTYVTAYLSVYTLLLLSLDRFLAVVHPIAALTIRTEQNAIYAIGSSWFIILAACIPLYIVHGLRSPEPLEGEIEIEAFCAFDDITYNHKAFHIGFITTMYFIPLIVIIVLYMLILFRLWYGVNMGGSRSAESVRGKKRVTRMVVIVVVSFMICWLPIQIVLLLKSFQLYPMTTPNVFFQIASHVLAYTNSCINPILYAFLSDPFRKAFRKVIACGPGRRQTFASNGRAGAAGKSLDTLPLHPRHGIHTFAVVRDAETSVTYTQQEELSEMVIEPTSNFLSPCNPTNTTTTTSFTNGGARDDSPPPYDSLRNNCNTPRTMVTYVW